MRKTDEGGFSVPELMTVCMIGLVLMVAAVPMFQGTFRNTAADGAAQLVAQQLTVARSLAVGSGTTIRVHFDSAASTFVVDPGGGSVRGPFVLPGKMKLRTSATSPDTPDSLGNTRLGSGELADIYFVDNGSAVQDPATNVVCSGTFFIERDDADPATRRAVTLFGGTGRIHVWRYDCQTNTWK